MERARYGVVHFSGWVHEAGRYWREGWHVFDRAYNGRVVAIHERTFTHGGTRRSENMPYTSRYSRHIPEEKRLLPWPPDPEVLARLQRAAKLDARRRNVEERRAA